MMKKMLLVFVCAILLTGVSAVAFATPVLWSISEGGNGHWYDVVQYRSTWDEANAIVQAEGLGYLATITSAAENEFVWSHFSYAGYWLGGYQVSSDNEPAGNWVWVTGEEWSYTNWALGQPDDERFVADENRLQFDWWAGGTAQYPANGYWNDLSSLLLSGSVESNLAGNPTGGYIVEYDRNPNAAVPIPSTMLLFGSGLAGLAVFRKRIRN
jgi:hypothetical protein